MVAGGGKIGTDALPIEMRSAETMNHHDRLTGAPMVDVMDRPIEVGNVRRTFHSLSSVISK